VHILYIVDMFPSVSQVFITREIKALEQLGVRISVLSLQEPVLGLPEHKLSRQIEADTIYSEDLSKGKFKKLFSHIRALCCFPKRYFSTFLMARIPSGLPARYYLFKQLPLYLEHFQGKDIDLIHCHFGWTGMVTGWMLSRLVGLPFTVTLHGSDVLVSPYKSLGTVLLASQKVVCVSNQIRQIVEQRYGVTTKKTEVVRCCADLKQFHYVAKTFQSLRIVTVARLHPVKGLRDLIEAYRVLMNDGIAFQAVIFGEGSERESLEGLIDQYGLTSHVALPGSIENEKLPEVFDSMDLFVLPSHSEGVPVSLMEAIAAGLPVVATDVGGVSELIDSNLTGFLVPARQPQMLAQAIGAFQRMSSAEKSEVAQAARKSIEKRFNGLSEANRLKQLFSDIAYGEQTHEQTCHCSYETR
jgi:glycosyltransferase involved in cell wall biosynthesis